MAHILKDKQALQRYAALCKTIAQDNPIDVNETKDQQQKRISCLRANFKKFVEYYFSHYSDSETPNFHIRLARKVRRNKTYKGWLKWARGHAKSVVAIVLLPLWLWINDDIKFMIVIGQNEDKAKILLSDLQAEFENNPRLINDFGSQKTIGSWEDGFFVTKSGFKAKAIGCGQDPRGIRVGPDRPDYAAADDWETNQTAKNPQRQDELAEWLLRGIIPAMDNKNRRCLIAQNHWTPRMIFSKIVEENDAWDIDRVDAYDPITYEPTWNKYSRLFFLDVEKEIGTLRALAEYNNTPHIEGKLFLDSMIQWAPMPRLKSFTAIVGRWDVAFAGSKTSDFNAIKIWGLHDGKKYLIDCFVKQSKVKTAVEWIADFQKNMLTKGLNIQIGFEAQFWNEEIYRTIAEVEQSTGFELNLIKIERRTGSKFDDLISMLPQYQNGRIYYCLHLKSHNDTHVGLAQLKGIEPGYKTKDDSPDADKYAFDYLDQFQTAQKFNHRAGAKRNSRKF